MAPIRIAYVTRTLAAYRHSVLDALAGRGLDPCVIVAGRMDDEIESVDPAPDARWTATRLHQTSWGWRHEVVSWIRSLRPDVILLEHGAKLDFAWTALLDRRVLAPNVLWTHGVERRDRFTGAWSLGGAARWAQLRLAEGILCYDEATASMLQGKFPSKVVGFARNTIDRSGFRATRVRLEAAGRPALRHELGLPDRFYLLGLGRLIAEKGFDRLAGVAATLRKSGLDVGIVIVGDGPERDRIAERCIAAGFRLGHDAFLPGEITDPDRLATWLYATDLCVNPGYLGLSVVDCAYGGVPVLSSRPGPKGPFHSPEWNYIVDGVTGWLAAEDTDGALADLALHYLRRSVAERAVTERACLLHAEAYLGIDVMVDGMVQTCEAVLARRRLSRRHRKGRGG